MQYPVNPTATIAGMKVRESTNAATSAKIAKSAYEENLPLRDAALASGLVTAEQFDANVRPEKMVRP